MAWLRLYDAIIDNAKVKMLAFEDRWHYVALLCCKKQGLLDGDDPEFTRDLIRVKLGLDAVALDKAMKRLARVRLIDPVTWQPLDWERHQFESDSGAERMRRYRERHARGGSGVTVTSPQRHRDVPEQNRTETEEASRPPKEQGDEGPSPAATDAPPPPVALTPDEPDEPGPCPYAEIVAKYHAVLPMCRRVEQLTPARKAAMRARWRNELPTVQAFANYFADVATAPFLTGRVDGRNGRPPFVADLDWLLRPSNFVKVLEGKYHAR